MQMPSANRGAAAAGKACGPYSLTCGNCAQSPLGPGHRSDDDGGLVCDNARETSLHGRPPRRKGARDDD